MWISLCQVVASDITIVYSVFMKEEKPKPLFIRLYKHQKKYIKKQAKANNMSEASYVRLLVDEERIRNESLATQ